MLFAFKAYRDTGELETGVLEGTSASDIHEQLRKRGLTPVSVGAGQPERRHWLTRDLSLAPAVLSPAELARISETLAALLQSGMTLPQALVFVAKTLRKRHHRQAFTRIEEAVASGASPSAAIAREAAVFPRDFTDLVAIGDAANRLPQTLSRASTTFAKRAAAAAQMRTAFVYPAVLVLAAFVLFAILIFVLVPAIKPVFDGAGISPNAALKVLFLAHAGMASAPGLVAAVAFVAVAVGVIGAMSGALGSVFRVFASRLPVFRTLIVTRAFGTVARSLALLTAAGAPLQDALRTTRESAPPRLQPILRAAERAVEEGTPVAEAFAAPITPEAFLQFIEIAERANRWPDLMETAADILDAEADRAQARLMQLLTPAITVAIGLVMGFFMISIVTALLGLNDALIP